MAALAAPAAWGKSGCRVLASCCPWDWIEGALHHPTPPRFSFLPHVRLVSSVQAVLATGSGIIVIRSCSDVITDR